MKHTYHALYRMFRIEYRVNGLSGCDQLYFDLRINMSNQFRATIACAYMSFFKKFPK